MKDTAYCTLDETRQLLHQHIDQLASDGDEQALNFLLAYARLRRDEPKTLGEFLAMRRAAK